MGFMHVTSVAAGLVGLAGSSMARTSAGVSRSSRSLEDNPYFEYDLSDFSLRFEKCQYVKMFDDELAQDEESDSPLALKHFVVSRLCPSDSCEDSAACDSGAYGRYVTDVESYLQYTIENQQKYLEQYCENCNEQCGNNEENGNEEDGNNNNNNNANYDCSCTDSCARYENPADYGYVDASQYIQCQQFQQNGDDDDGANAMYVGPRCSSSGNQITIGFFSDEECYEPIQNINVEQVLGGTLSYHLLTQSYETDSTNRYCLSCKEDNNQNQQNEDQQDGNNDADANDANDADDVNEMCENLYNVAAKCESPTGLTSGFVQSNRDDNDYENQVENEYMACSFINSLVWNSYTEAGEINVGEPQDVYVRTVTKNQKISMAILTLSLAGLVGLMEYFRRKIETINGRAELVGPSAHSVLT